MISSSDVVDVFAGRQIHDRVGTEVNGGVQLSSSSPTLLVTALLPMLALILHFAAMPIAMGSSAPAAWTLLAGITMRPAATSSRINSTGRSSRLATNSISGVISPARADSSCV